ncbi:hypothetical protein CTI12_AA220460 [Artemisia annua]|uniref:N-acetyltransferase domain-containing protein n=1 Tax=Artemisia annua TaxID=35608 RepID=A0A2U1NV37_ARTAN|nr:hypothetical protein CTI12_AA220460 [Artemisia annua]
MVLILSILYNASILAGIVTRPVVSACHSTCPPVDTARRKRIHRLCRGHQHFHEQPATTDTTLPPAARVGHRGEQRPVTNRGIHYSVSEGFQTECQIQGLVDNAKSTCAIDGGTLRDMLLQPSLSNVHQLFNISKGRLFRIGDFFIHSSRIQFYIVLCSYLLDALDSFIVVEREGQIITSAALFPFYEDECGEVAAIAVSPDCRGQGQGDKLLGAEEIGGLVGAKPPLTSSISSL